MKQKNATLFLIIAEYFSLYKKHLLEEGVEPDHIIEIPFDSFEYIKLRDPEILYPYVKEKLTDDRMYYLLLDEVQLLGEFESVLNGFMRIPNVEIMVVKDAPAPQYTDDGILVLSVYDFLLNTDSLDL